MTEKLLPCPFCGGEATYHNGYPPYDKCHFIDCAQCDVSTPILSTKLDVAAVWNKRAQPAGEGEKPVAWMHTMDNTEGIKSNKPWTVITTSKRNPFGKPGVDYSKSYPVTSTPLYAAPPTAANQRIAELEREVAEWQRDYDALRDHEAELVDQLRGKSKPAAANQAGENCGHCHTCAPITMDNMRMILCKKCGNKRCPQANDHRNACTGSNEPGQPGSAYPESHALGAKQ